jgi:hypothetical protein
MSKSHRAPSKSSQNFLKFSSYDIDPDFSLAPYIDPKTQDFTQDPSAISHSIELLPEHHLWQAVLLDAITTVFRSTIHSNSDIKYNTGPFTIPNLFQRTKHWLLHSNTPLTVPGSFNFICFHLNLDPIKLRKKLLALTPKPFFNLHSYYRHSKRKPQWNTQNQNQ